MKNKTLLVTILLALATASFGQSASSPSAYGGYYAWGETTTKESYTDDNSITLGKNMGNIAGNSYYDAARANWDGK